MLHRYKFYVLLLPEMVTINFTLLTKLGGYARNARKYTQARNYGKIDNAFPECRRNK